MDILRSGETKFLDFGGTSHLEGFLRTTHEFINRERPTVSVFDGDTAGLRSIKALQGYFGNKKINFRSNQEYLILKKDFEIEYYFPDDWLKSIYDMHPGWFDDFTFDVEDNIVSLSVKDNRKKNFQNEIFNRIDSSDDYDWMVKWKPVLEKIESSLNVQKQLLENQNRQLTML